ncbi:MAG: hypothetical protein IKU64_06740 [Bacteroides sp.]|nr:hypothetical protein [Bacteroides sp.]
MKLTDIEKVLLEQQDELEALKNEVLKDSQTRNQRMHCMCQGHEMQ